MMIIKRLHGQYEGRCRAVSFGNTVYAVATDTSSSETVAEQTKLTLAALEKNLTEIGSGKAGLLQVTVYLRDISTKPEMEAEWLKWIGSKDNWPQRACVGADLAGNDLVEVVATAAIL